jgi:uncharacterized membrane protein
MSIPSLPLHRTDRVMSILAWMSILFLWIIIGYKLPQLPQAIPVHFDDSGAVDGYGSKYTLLFIPTILTGLSLLFHFLLKKPERYNYPIQITPQNAQRVYTITARMLRWFRLNFCIFFFAISLHIINSSRTQHADLPVFWIIFMLAGTILPLFVYLIIVGNNQSSKI